MILITFLSTPPAILQEYPIIQAACRHCCYCVVMLLILLRPRFHCAKS